MLTPKQLKEIRERADKATPGEWEDETWGTYYTPEGIGLTSVGGIRYVSSWEEFKQDKKDVEFIAHARQDIPALLDEVDRLNNKLAVIDDIMDGLKSSIIDGNPSDNELRLFATLEVIKEHMEQQDD